MYRNIESELSLGLSLGRCFAVDPGEMPQFQTSNATLSVLPNGPEILSASAPLVRTSSLPTGVEEWSRKRKEGRSLERVLVKRKLTEKVSGSRPLMSEAGRGVPEEESSRSEGLRWSSFDSGRSLEGSDISGSSNSTSVTSLPNTRQHSTVTVDPLPPRLRTLKSLQEEWVLKRAAGNLNRQEEMGRNIIDEMPCVSVRGCQGIEGFLYRYRRGGEVRIVCVCHGNFFTPAEFVKHARGGDVAHPLKHIVVNPSPPVYY